METRISGLDLESYNSMCHFLESFAEYQTLPYIYNNENEQYWEHNNLVAFILHSNSNSMLQKLHNCRCYGSTRQLLYSLAATSLDNKRKINITEGLHKKDKSNTLFTYRSLQKYTPASDYSLHFFTVGIKVDTYIGHCICIPWKIFTKFTTNHKGHCLLDIMYSSKG